MQDLNSPKVFISKVFFASELSALTLYGLMGAGAFFLADEVIQGAIMGFATIAVPSAVFAFRLPARWPNRHPLGRIVAMVLAMSVFGPVLMYFDASSYWRLSSYSFESPQTNYLYVTAIISLLAFALALLVNLGAILYATSPGFRSRRQ